jgi:hypothetical protein
MLAILRPRIALCSAPACAAAVAMLMPSSARAAGGSLPLRLGATSGLPLGGTPTWQ